MNETNTFQETWQYVVYTFFCTVHPTIFKCVGSAVLVTFSFLFDIKQSDTLFALFILILLDFATGIAAARYNNEPIRSRKIKHTAIKLTVYFAVIAGAHLAESGLFAHFSVLDETVTAFFLLTELLSLIENAGKMGVDTPKGLINKLVDYKKKI